MAAIAVGLLPLLTVELALRAFGLPTQPPPVDPYVDLHNLLPLFQPASEPGVMEIGPERMDLFRPATFAVPKPPGSFRVFALGGSTTYGEPYSSETAFPQWLEIYLQAAAPEKSIEVINCGGLSYASYRVLAILQEVLQYEPDLIVVYTGQNEYLEQRSYANFRPHRGVARVVHMLSSLHTVQFTRSVISGGAQRPGAGDKSRTVMQSEVDALLDYQGGLQAYRRGAAWREPVVEHFQWNLHQMARACRTHQIPLMLVNPVTNLLDCPPMKFEVDPQLSSEQQLEFDHLWQQARSTQATDTAIELLNEALAVDPGHAGALFLLGRLHYQSGDYEQAMRALTAAKDADVCPLRATSEIQQAVVGVARDRGLLLVDADELFSRLSEHAIVGNAWLVDHVHPTIEGNEQLGQALAEAVLDAGILKANSGDWRETGQKLARRHLSSLGEEYFHRGKQRLEGLILWTQGRAKKIRPPSDAPSPTP